MKTDSAAIITRSADQKSITRADGVPRKFPTTGRTPRLMPARAALLCIVLVALGLRLWNITFDLPLGRGLEQLEVMRALELGMGKFNFERITKGGLFYLLFAEYGMLYVGLWAWGTIKSSQDFALYYMSDPFIFFLLGRLTSAIMGTISVLLVYNLGKKIFDWQTGLLASLLFALYPIHIKFSHIICVDIPMVMFTLAAFSMIVSIPAKGNLRHYMLAGLFIGLAMMHKLPAAVVIFPFLLTHAWRLREERKNVFGWIDQRILAAFVIMMLIYIAGTPGVLAYPGKMLALVGEISYGHVYTEAYSGKTPNLWGIHMSHFYTSMGLPLFVFFLSGIIHAIFAGSIMHRSMAIFCLIFYIGLGSSSFREWSPHYGLPIIPFGLILASKAIFLTEKLSNFIKTHENTIPCIFLALTILPLIYNAGNQVHEFDLQNTKDLAKHWIEHNIESGKKILLYGFPGLTYSQSVPIRDLPENFLNEAKESEKIGNKLKATYLRMKASSQEGAAYDLVPVHMQRMLWESPEYYRQQNIEYIILDKQYFDEEEEVQYSREYNESRKEFYKRLLEDPEVSLVVNFDPKKLKARGPMLEIYRLRAAHHN